jgi:hypothetical protein
LLRKFRGCTGFPKEENSASEACEETDQLDALPAVPGSKVPTAFVEKDRRAGDRRNEPTSIDSGEAVAAAVWSTTAQRRAIVLMAFAVVAAVTLTGAPRQPSGQADESAAVAPQMGAKPLTAPAVAPIEPKVPLEPQVTIEPRKPTAYQAPVAVVAATAIASQPGPALALPEEESTSQTDVPSATATTITGCVERDDETFRLKDAAGTDVPRSRSWKSGFLKRRPAAIELVDAADRLTLPTYVGQRVAATGVLVDRELQVRSLRRIAFSCS